MARVIDTMHVGLDRVIGAWERDGALIDPGPSNSIDTVLAGMDGDPEAVFLTHIHLDHAGATGTLVRRFPDLRVYVHEIGAPHLIDPERLLRSAARLYGDDMDRLWGEVVPVPEANVTTLRGGETVEGLRVLYTPGHASHHVTYFDEGTGDAFVGDVGGVLVPPTSEVWIPTPPPDIDLELWGASIAAVRELGPARLGLTHFGPVDDPAEHLDAAEEELHRLGEAARTGQPGGVPRRPRRADRREPRGRGRADPLGDASGSGLARARAVLAQALRLSAGSGATELSPLVVGSAGMDALETEIAGSRGSLYVRTWPNEDASFVALIAHGYGEHIGRYEHVAERLVAEGAVVIGPDHLGHGRSAGERALVERGEDMTDDLHLVVERARTENPGLPVVLIGHSMGGLIATRFAQRYGDELAALVLSGPIIGGNAAIEALLELDPIPEVPIDPAGLSRDPAVGEAYAADPLVYHGPFKRATLEALFDGVGRVAAEPSDLGGLPTLWIHGTEDPLAPLESTRPAAERLAGSDFTERIYEGAAHEVFNETNREEVLDDVVAFIHRALSN